MYNKLTNKKWKSKNKYLRRKNIMKKRFCQNKVSGSIVEVWNEPVLGTGMYPVNWNGTEWVRTTVDKWDYNYESVAKTKTDRTIQGNGKGKWANAMTEDGSIYVWIPRYTYKIVSGYHKAVNSWNRDTVSRTKNELGKIEIKFSDGLKDDTSDGFILHPAFSFGEDELTGFWVMKFTASRIVATSQYKEKNIVSSRPNVVAWRDITVGEAFNYSYELNRELDSHLMKNIEWGAVAYLTNAIGRIPYINNCGHYITGMSGISQNAKKDEKCCKWNTCSGVKASTTHNVYGVYDMSGGTWEYVAGYYGSPNVEYANSIVNAREKYKDVYNDSYSDKVYGDGVYETSVGVGRNEYAWDKDCSLSLNSNYPFFIRGGCYRDAVNAGIFSFCYADGDGHYIFGFRVALAIKEN